MDDSGVNHKLNQAVVPISVAELDMTSLLKQIRIASGTLYVAIEPLINKQDQKQVLCKWEGYNTNS